MHIVMQQGINHDVTPFPFMDMLRLVTTIQITLAKSKDGTFL